MAGSATPALCGSPGGPYSPQSQKVMAEWASVLNEKCKAEHVHFNFKTQAQFSRFSLRLQYLLTESGHQGSEELYDHLERGAADVRHHGPGAGPGHGERA